MVECYITIPNWCENRLTITGDMAELKRLKKNAVFKYKKVEKGEDKENTFSIAKLYPMPKEFAGGSSPAHIVAEKDYEAELAKWKIESKKAKKDDRYFHTGKPITKKMSEEYKKKYGAEDWYMWAIKHWGTKWDTRCSSQNTEEDFKTTKELNYDFDTAWSPPCGALVVISKTYPKLTFELNYCESGMGFSGDYHVKNGRVLMDNELDRPCEDCEQQAKEWAEEEKEAKEK